MKFIVEEGSGFGYQVRSARRVQGHYLYVRYMFKGQPDLTVDYGHGKYYKCKASAVRAAELASRAEV